MASSVVWTPVPNGDVDGYNMRIESNGDGVWRIWLGGAAIIFPPEYRLCRATPGRALVVTDEVVEALHDLVDVPMSAERRVAALKFVRQLLNELEADDEQAA